MLKRKCSFLYDTSNFRKKWKRSRAARQRKRRRTLDTGRCCPQITELAVVQSITSSSGTCSPPRRTPANWPLPFSAAVPSSRPTIRFRPFMNSLMRLLTIALVTLFLRIPPTAALPAENAARSNMLNSSGRFLYYLLSAAAERLKNCYKIMISFLPYLSEKEDYRRVHEPSFCLKRKKMLIEIEEGMMTLCEQPSLCYYFHM